MVIQTKTWQIHERYQLSYDSLDGVVNQGMGIKGI